MFGERTFKSLNYTQIRKYQSAYIIRNMKRYKWLLQRDAEGFFVAEICDSAQSSASAIGLCLRTGSVLLSVASWVRFTSCLLCLKCVAEASELFVGETEEF